MGGLAPKTLLRAIERLRSDGDADVSLAALASDAGLSRSHFCRAFKESTGLSPHAWLPTAPSSPRPFPLDHQDARPEEHTSELQSLMRISYAVFCLPKRTHTTNSTPTTQLTSN